MAITLNKCAAKCEKMAIASGQLSPTSSARPLLYDISRDWRNLLAASPFRGDGPWSEKELRTGELILDAVTYLHRLGCKDIERLLKGLVARRERQMK